MSADEPSCAFYKDKTFRQARYKQADIVIFH